MVVKYKTEGKTLPKAGTTKKATRTKKSDALSILASEIDELGMLEDKVAKASKKMVPMQARIKEIKEEIGLYVTGKYDPDQNALLKGADFICEISNQSNSSKVTDMFQAQELLNAIEPELFVALAKLGITDLRKYLTPAQFESITETTRSGARRMKLVAQVKGK